MDDLIKASNINGVHTMIINKIDVLEKLGQFNSIVGGSVVSHQSRNDMEKFIQDVIYKNCPTVREITFSVSPYDI